MLIKYLFPDSITTGWLFVELFFAGAVVVLAAVRLTGLADRFAEEWGLGKAFVGMLLLATVTSLPEVVAGATAGALGAVDMAFGAVYGSCSFNIVIIVIMNLVLTRGGSVLGAARSTQLLTSSFGIVMIAISLLAITMVQKFTGRPVVQQGVEMAMTAVIIVTYVSCMHLTHRFERRESVEAESVERAQRSLGLLFQIVCISLVTIGAAWWLTKTGDVLSKHPIEMIGRPLGETLIGIFFLAAATSLPEIATSVTAVRMGNLDMALGNVFGSNMFNVMVLPVVKVATALAGRPLMMSGEGFAANINILAGLLPVLLTAVAVAGIAYRTERRVLRLGFDSVLLLAIYLGGMVAILTSGSSP